MIRDPDLCSAPFGVGIWIRIRNMVVADPITPGQVRDLLSSGFRFRLLARCSSLGMLIGLLVEWRWISCIPKL